MALSNRDRIDRMFQVMAPALDDFISSVIGQADPAMGAEWTKLVQAQGREERRSGRQGLRPARPAGSVPDAHRRQHHRRLQAGLVSVQPGAWAAPARPSPASCARSATTWAHNGTFTDDDAYRALDTGERLLKLIGASAEADEVRRRSG